MILHHILVTAFALLVAMTGATYEATYQSYRDFKVCEGKGRGGLLGEGKGKRVRPYGSESRLKRAKGQRLPQHSPAGV